MAKKMRVISQRDYDLLMGLRRQEPPAERLENQMQTVLDNRSKLPDDIQTLLYNDMARRLHKQQIVDSSSPLLVTTKTSNMHPTDLGINSLQNLEIKQVTTGVKKPDATPAPAAAAAATTAVPVEYDNEDEKRRSLLRKCKGRKAGDILQVLEKYGVGWNERNEMTIQNKRVPSSNIQHILSSLATGKNLDMTIGMPDISKIVTQNQIPYNVLNRSVQAQLRFQTPKRTIEHRKSKSESKISPRRLRSQQNVPMKTNRIITWQEIK